MAGAATQAVPQLDELVELGRAAGLDAVGIAPAEPFVSTRTDLEVRKAGGLHGGMQFTYRKPERSTDPSQTLPGVKALVVGAKSYLRHEPRPPSRPWRPTAAVARYAWTDHYRELRAALDTVASRLRVDGWKTRVLADDNALVDREAARRAGIGWYGKNANLLLPGAGSWFVLGSILTDAPLPTATQDDLVPDGCGSCTRCIDGCPTGAIVTAGVVDARKCLAWLVQAEGVFPREYRVALGDRLYGCDDCQEVCPPNRRVARQSSRAGGTCAEDIDRDALDAADATEARVDVMDLLWMSDEELLERFGRWYIPRREPRYLRRNALVVLGNVGDRGDPTVRKALLWCLGSHDPLIKAHAVWAARRMGRPDLLAGVKRNRNPMVREELEAPVEVRRA